MATSIDYSKYVIPYTGDPNAEYIVRRRAQKEQARSNRAREAAAMKQMKARREMEAAALSERKRAAQSREANAQGQLALAQTTQQFQEKSANMKAITKGLEAVQSDPTLGAALLKNAGVTKEGLPEEEWAVEDVVPEGAAPDVETALEQIGFGPPETDEFLAREQRGLERKRRLPVSPYTGDIEGFTEKGPDEARVEPAMGSEMIERQRQVRDDARIPQGRPARVSPYSGGIDYVPSGATPRGYESVRMEPTTGYVDRYGGLVGENIVEDSRATIAAKKEKNVGLLRSEYSSRVQSLKGTKYEKLIPMLEQTFDRVAEVYELDPIKGAAALNSTIEFHMKQVDSAAIARTMAGTRKETSRIAALNLDMRNAEQAVDNMEQRHVRQETAKTVSSINNLDAQITAWERDKTNPATQEQLQLSLARITQPGGVLTDKDVSRTIGAEKKSMVDQLSNFFTQKFQGGDLPDYYDQAISAVRELREEAKGKIQALYDEDLTMSQERIDAISPATLGKNPWMKRRFKAAMGIYAPAIKNGWLTTVDGKKPARKPKKKRADMTPAESATADKESDDGMAALRALGVQ